MDFRFGLYSIIGVIAAVGLLPASEGAAWADSPALTLDRALAEAYQKNPDLEAARAELRGTDEEYAQAMAGFKPVVNGTAGYTSSHRRLDTGTTTGDPKTLGMELTQSLYAGGATTAEVDKSSSDIRAGRARLHVTEQQVLLNGVTAYMNFLRDQEIVRLRQNNEKVLESHLKASNERFSLGDITKTDVSQSESRFAAATASRIAAEADLKKSRAFFEQVVGLPPENLQKPEVTLPLPETEEEALALALRKNPTVVQARYAEEAAKASTRSAQAENLPQIDLTGAMAKTYDPASVASDDESTRSVAVTLTLPLYAGGSTVSKIRQSRQAENQLRMATYSAERAVRQAVVAARESLAAAEAESKARQTQIDASKLALDGVKVEADYGSRTTLDLLDAEQEYLDAQVAHVAAEADRIIASYSFMAALGGLTATGLKLDVPVYDAEKNFQNLNSNGFVWAFHGDK